MMSPRDRRVVHLGMGAIVAAILMLRVAPWTLRFIVQERDRLKAGRALLAQARRDLGEASRFEDSAATVRTMVDSLGSRILTGDSDAEAWSDLENRLRLAATRNGGALKASTRLPDSTRAGLLQRVVGRAEIESDLHGALAVLRAIEAGSPILRVEEVRFEAANPDSPVGGPEVLRAEFVVAGWFLSRPNRAGTK